MLPAQEEEHHKRLVQGPQLLINEIEAKIKAEDITKPIGTLVRDHSEKRLPPNPDCCFPVSRQILIAAFLGSVV